MSIAQITEEMERVIETEVKRRVAARWKTPRKKKASEWQCRTLSHEEFLLAEQLRGDNVSWRDIATAINNARGVQENKHTSRVTDRYISRVSIRANFVRTGRALGHVLGRGLSPRELRRAITLKRQGLGPKRIAAQLGTTEYKVRYALRKQNQTSVI